MDDDHYILWLYFVPYTVCGMLQLYHNQWKMQTSIGSVWRARLASKRFLLECPS